jgi:transposase
MKRMYACCAGMDVHKASVYVCLLKAQGPELVREVRTFGTTTRSLLELLDWLTSKGCESAAMESTGVYWKPVFNLLEGALNVVLINAQHCRGLPGRKTDVKDCEWIAELHMHGLVRPSFLPASEIRELRDLVRTRTTLIADRSRQINRVQKVLEDANIKLGNVAADVLGVSGRAMIEGLIAGETNPQALAELARGRMRSKRIQLREALEGKVKPHHRLLMQTHLQVIDGMNCAIETLTTEIEERMRPFSAIRDRLDAVTGVGPEAATVLISEMGADLSAFPTPGHAASWAGLCPGHQESAGKHKSGRTRHGNRWLKTVFTQVGWAASRADGTYLQAHFRRVCRRRGVKKAALAAGHSAFVRCVAMIQGGSEYRELGASYFDQRAKTTVTRKLVNRLNQLGYAVTLQPLAAA